VLCICGNSDINRLLSFRGILLPLKRRSHYPQSVAPLIPPPRRGGGISGGSYRKNLLKPKKTIIIEIKVLRESEMLEAVSVSCLRKVLREHGFSCRKRWGQNFLVDANIINKIVDVAELSPADTVIEIGAGTGALTRSLASRAGLVITVEVDKRLAPVLKEILGGFNNVEVVYQDAMELNFDNLAREKTAARFGVKPSTYKIVANIPYYITTPLILHLLKNRFSFSFLILMIQKEVGLRLVAGPGSKDYGSLSIAVQYYSVPKILFRVPRTVFYPMPEVESVVVSLTRREIPAVEVPDEDLFFTLVRHAFGQRRKTILNALTTTAQSFGLTRAELKEILESTGINPELRGESLAIEEFVSLAKRFGKK